MRLDYKQSQFELFPDTNDRNDRVHKGAFSISSLTLSVEHIIILGILVLMAMILMYASGVEKGKRLTNAASEPSPAVVVPENDILAAPASASVPVQTPAVEEELRPVPLRPAKEQEEIADPAPEKFDETYTVQVASFKSEKYAYKEVSNIGDIGYETFVMPKGRYSIVCVGKFAERHKAKMLLSKMKKRYKDCLVRRF